MLDPEKRRAIPMLKSMGYGERRIARMLKVSRAAVRKALAEGGEVAPRPQRETAVTTHRPRSPLGASQRVTIRRLDP